MPGPPSRTVPNVSLAPAAGPAASGQAGAGGLAASHPDAAAGEDASRPDPGTGEDVVGPRLRGPNAGDPRFSRSTVLAYAPSDESSAPDARDGQGPGEARPRPITGAGPAFRSRPDPPASRPTPSSPPPCGQTRPKSRPRRTADRRHSL
jgi:hypothetical protein